MKPIYKIILLIITSVLVTIYFTGCPKTENPEPTNNIENAILKQVIGDLNHDRDSLLKATKLNEITSIEYIDRWRTLKGRIDSIPCDSAIILVVNTCDTIIDHDSTLISDLKTIIKVDSNIIAQQEQIIKNDSIKNAETDKQIEKHMRAKRHWRDGRCRHFTKEVRK